MNPTTKQNNTSNNTPSSTTDNSDLLSEIETLKKTMLLMSKEISTLKEIVTVHNHNGKDGTKILENSLNLKPSEIIQMGNFRLEEISDKAGTNVQQAILVVGKDKEDTLDSDNSQLIIEHQGNTDGTTNRTFIYADRNPLKTGFSGVIVSGGSTFTTKELRFESDELVGAQLIVYSGSSFEVKTILSNNSNIVNIQGTWSVSNNNAVWLIMMPVYLGAAEYPWRQVYAGGEDVSTDGSGAQRRAIRLGYGPTSVCAGIYFGTGVPVLSAPNGSLFLRTDGAAATALYIMAGGAWSAR